MVHEKLLASRPDADIRIHYVWVRVFPEDERDLAESLSRELADPRAVHYWDRPFGIGRALREQLFPDAMELPWDVYLFYKGDAEWHDVPPEPFEWSHQMQVGGTHEKYNALRSMPEFLDSIAERLDIDG